MGSPLGPSEAHLASRVQAPDTACVATEPRTASLGVSTWPVSQQFSVIRSESEYQQFLVSGGNNTGSPASSSIPVDFNSQMLLVARDGGSSICGTYSEYRFTKACYGKDKATVEFEMCYAPFGGFNCLMAFWSKIDIAVAPRTALPVEINVVSCPQPTPVPTFTPPPYQTN